MNLSSDRETPIEHKIKALFGSCVRHSKKRGHKPPGFNEEEFREWITSQERWDCIVQNWMMSDFNTYLAPSVDRLDESRGYFFDNIRLVTWIENASAHNSFYGSIEVYDREGNFLHTCENTYVASFLTGDKPYSISANCRGRTKLTENKYQYKYTNSDKKIVKILRQKTIPVYKVTVEGEIVAKYESLTQACRENGNPDRTHEISNCCKGVSNIYAGHRWCYADEESYKALIDKYTVQQYDLEGNFIRDYPSREHAYAAAGGNVSQAIRTGSMGRGYLWKMKTDLRKVKPYVRHKQPTKELYQLTPDGELVKEWENINEAVSVGGYRRKGIEKVLYRKRNTYAGCVWSRTPYLPPPR